jgi:hypothetical protein
MSGIEEETFQSLAEDAKKNCPVSKALAGTDIPLSATLYRASGVSGGNLYRAPGGTSHYPSPNDYVPGLLIRLRRCGYNPASTLKQR